MTPTIGRIVVYTVSEYDTQQGRREHGNDLVVGDHYPAMIVKVWSDTCVNLQVFLDGPEVMWRTSSMLGVGEGSWQWPQIQQAKVEPKEPEVVSLDTPVPASLVPIP